jgi:hypothetical protein
LELFRLTSVVYKPIMLVLMVVVGVLPASKVLHKLTAAGWLSGI